MPTFSDIPKESLLLERIMVLPKWLQILLTPFTLIWFIYHRIEVEHQMRSSDFDPDSDIGFSPFLQEAFAIERLRRASIKHKQEEIAYTPFE